MPIIKSSNVNILSVPKVAVPTVINGKAAFNLSSNIKSEGSVVLEGTSEPGWSLGFIQTEWVDTNWIHYKGDAEDDGSIFFQRSRPPSRPVNVCRDVDPDTDVFYPGSEVKLTGSEKLPLTLKSPHSDSPADGCDAVVTNSLTKKDNFLHEAQFEFLFCTILSLRDPKGEFHHLNGFYWNVRWQATFCPEDVTKPKGKWKVTVNPKGLGQATAKVFKGAPDDKRFKDKLTDMKVPGCNALIRFYTNMPPGHKCRREDKSKSKMFDVTK